MHKFLSNVSIFFHLQLSEYNELLTHFSRKFRLLSLKERSAVIFIELYIHRCTNVYSFPIVNQPLKFKTVKYQTQALQLQNDIKLERPNKSTEKDFLFFDPSIGTIEQIPNHTNCPSILQSSSMKYIRAIWVAPYQIKGGQSISISEVIYVLYNKIFSSGLLSVIFIKMLQVLYKLILTPLPLYPLNTFKNNH